MSQPVHTIEKAVSQPPVYEIARREAQEIRAATRITCGLNELIEIAERWNATVTVTPLENNLSGFIIKEHGTDPRIYINSQDTEERQRFTLAHEIGHLVERAEVSSDSDYSFIDYRKSEGYNLHEFFADEFAGELLMPAAEFIDTYQENGAFGTARYFNVSVPAVNRRLIRLKKNPPLQPVPAGSCASYG